MPLTPQSEPRRKGSPRWALAFWLVVIAIRMWFVNRIAALAVLAIALVLFLTGLRRNGRASGPARTSMPMPTSMPTSTSMPTPRIETVAMPPTPPDARPIEPDVGGATGKLIVLAIVLLGLGILVALLWKRLPVHGWHP